jgi:hypothetical protein
MSTHSVNFPALGLALSLVAGAALADGPGLGKSLNEADIAAWDINIQPDGKGLPPGSGTAAKAPASSPKDAALAMVRRARAGSPALRPRHYRH